MAPLAAAPPMLAAGDGSAAAGAVAGRWGATANAARRGATADAICGAASTGAEAGRGGAAGTGAEAGRAKTEAGAGAGRAGGACAETPPPDALSHICSSPPPAATHGWRRTSARLQRSPCSSRRSPRSTSWQGAERAARSGAGRCGQGKEGGGGGGAVPPRAPGCAVPPLRVPRCAAALPLSQWHPRRLSRSATAEREVGKSSRPVRTHSITTPSDQTSAE
jgi:hypothetical protein